MIFMVDDDTPDGAELGDVAYIDGYSVGDTLLEGCMFECRIVGDKIEVKVTDDCAKYFSGLNQEMWLKEISEFVNSDDCDTFQAYNRAVSPDAWIA